MPTFKQFLGGKMTKTTPHELIDGSPSLERKHKLKTFNFYSGEVITFDTLSHVALATGNGDELVSFDCINSGKDDDNPEL